MKHKITLVVLFIGLISYSQQIITDRPDQTESSSTIPKGSLQIEMGFVASSYENINGFVGPSTLLRVGLLKGLELRIFNQYESYKLDFEFFNEAYSGISDLEAGFKVQLLKKEDVNTEIAFLSHIIIPTANDELSNDEVGIINKLSISHNISNKVSIGYNIGYDYKEQIHSFTYSAALAFSLGKQLGSYIEAYGTYAEQGFYKSFLNVGFTSLISDNFQLDAAYGLGLNNDLQFFSAGFSWNIPRMFSSK
ncbi:MAG: transporter [Flavobacteriaceae bacterium]|nr:transporter [Flavobacteriaceae bacterium]